MDRIPYTQIKKEECKAVYVRNFPESLKERAWNIKNACEQKVTLEGIYIEALSLGLREIERKSFRIPEFIEEPGDG